MAEDVLKKGASPAAELAGGDVRIAVVGQECLDVIYEMNLVIFDEERIINTFDRDDLTMLLTYVGEEPVGFKIGYRESRFVFYSAKGGVLPEYRRRGLARAMLVSMVDLARDRGYARFAFDTFPNRDPGMAILAMTDGYRIVRADFNATYRDYRLRFEKKL